MNEPLPMNMQEAEDTLDMLTFEIRRMFDASDSDPGSHVESCLESVKLARLHAKAACHEIAKA